MILGFLIAIFLLPYHVPMHDPTDSQAWEFGYNNIVAQGLIALLLLCLFAWEFFFGNYRIDEDLLARTLVPENPPISNRPLLITMAVFQAISATIVIVWYHILPLAHYGEFTYFIQRVEAAVLGGAPFVDFAFDYGPAMLALPVDIYRIFHGAVSVEAAYAASLVIHYILGLALIAYIVSQINTRWRALIMGLFGFGWINLTMGLNYTPLRFSIALASLFAVRHLHRLTRQSPGRQMVVLGLAAFFLPLLNYSLSPEMGLALTLGLCVYFFWFLFGPERRLALLAPLVLAGVGVTAFWFPRPYFDSMLSFGKGGANFPVLPTMHILSFLAVAIWAYPRLGLIAVREKSAAGPFCAAFAVLCGLFILPATGRCDPGHVWINSMGIFIVALAAMSWMKSRWQYGLLGAYIIIYPITLQISFWDHYDGQIEGVLSVRHMLQNYSYHPDNYAGLPPGAPLPRIHYSKLLPMSPELNDFPKAKIGMPLGDDEAVQRYLALTGRNVPEYHIAPFGDFFDASSFDRKYQDLKAMKYVFVPMDYLNYLMPSTPFLDARQAQLQAQADCKFLSSLLIFPVDLPLVHPLLHSDGTIMKRIQKEYNLVKQYPNGVLLKRKDAAGT